MVSLIYVVCSNLSWCVTWKLVPVTLVTYRYPLYTWLVLSGSNSEYMYVVTLYDLLTGN